MVVDIFSGSNTTGEVAEELGRRWLTIENNREYAILSAIRFMVDLDIDSVRAAIEAMEDGAVLAIQPKDVSNQRLLFEPQ